MTEPEPVYTAQQVADRFQINIQTVWANVRNHNWPHTKFGSRTIRFTETHIQQILTSHDKQPQAPRPSRRRRQI